MRELCLGSDERKRKNKYFAMYALKKPFKFKNRMQVEAFLEVASLYGRSTLFGNVVIFEAGLDFCMWRKLINLSKILLKETTPDIRALSTKAGLRIFKEAKN